jgi:hypothetical protein
MTGGSKIANRVFYLPIPVGTYEAGDLAVELYKGTEKKADLTPEAWKTSEVKIERGKGKKITYTVTMDITANSIHEINDNIQKELSYLATKKTIKEGETFTFTVTGATLTPTAADNMLLIPTYDGKNINVILNIQNAIDASAEALNIAEAAYGVESTSVDGQWKLKSGKSGNLTPIEIVTAAAAAQRTFTVNFAGTTDSKSNVNVFAPTSNVYFNTITVDNTIKNLEATTAKEVNSLQLGVEDGYKLTSNSVIIRGGGIFVGSHVSIGQFESYDMDVNFYGVCSGKFIKNGSGILFIEANAEVAALINDGTGDIIVDGDLTDNAFPSLWTRENANINIIGTAETV